MKFNVGVAAASALLIWASLGVIGPRRRNPRLWLVYAAAVFAITFLACFKTFGGPMDAVPDFLRGGFRLASGYSAQMSVAGPAFDLYAALACFALAGLLAVAGGWFDRRYAVLALISSGSVFLTFKSGFVRHDPSHVILFVQFLPAVVALFLVLPLTRIREWTAAGMCLIVLSVAIYDRRSLYPQPELLPVSAYLPGGLQNLRARLRGRQVVARRNRRQKRCAIGCACRMRS